MGTFEDVEILKHGSGLCYGEEETTKHPDIMDIGEAFLAMCEEELN